ncbi:ABC transporter permease subunit [Candidatus Phytoplasma solani]|uniref:ABC-type amino acid transport system, permease component n=1 Tax=Candidatus Phytoplasma solani TaxID=69896 RepID=A0A421NYW7_9MOLU|nr:ABC transporter permease subunit [Candidatus Phytoplasma solani]RMI89196.1 ABC-type amino acid transport system, permease component [Candidatus Phytoplasma solani]RMI89214.1 ABC-type amino acid transport system, permease component [Candidatus Phytoplasma solani]
MNNEANKKNNFLEQNDGTNSFLRNSTSECFLLVKDKIVDGFITDDLIIKALFQKHNQEFKKFKLTLQETIPPYGIFIKKNNKSVKELIEKGIKTAIQENQEKLDDINSNIEQITDYYEKNFVPPAFGDYIQINEKLETTNKTNLDDKIQKILKTFPSYAKSFVNSLVVVIDSVVLGFLLSLLLVKAKILVNYYRQTQKKALMKMYQTFSFVIDRFVSFLNAIPISIQSLLVFNFITTIESFKNIKIAFSASLIVLLLNTIANLIQIMMHNINLLDKGQIEAGYALGMTQKQVFNCIIFEQSIKKTYPAVGKQFITNIKDISLFSIIGFSSLLWQAQSNASVDLDIWTPYIIVCCVYLIIVFITNFILKILNRNKI